MAKVYLSAGHGGSDPGAVANGFKEKDLNLSITLACEDELVRHGVDVKMSRTTDKDMTWQQEVNECNAYDPDLAVNIHNNAGGGDGAEVFHTYTGGTGKALANNILAEIIEIGQNSRGAKTKRLSNGADYYYFVREIAAPSVVVECAFVDHAEDIKIIDTAAEQKIMGIAIAKGILKTLGIAEKEAEKQEPAAEPENEEVSADDEDVCKLELRYLRKGDEGADVKALQQLLLGNGISCGNWGADGDFGSDTDAAVKAYQKEKGLDADGIVGPKTWKKLLGVS